MAKGFLHVTTSPIKGDIMVNNEYRGTGDINIELEEGTYQVSFHPTVGYITPSALNIIVNAGYTALVNIEYMPA